MAEGDAPVYADWVTLLRQDSDYLRQAAAPAYWSLAPFYVGQVTDTACSLAAAAMVINAARAALLPRESFRPALQEAVLEAVGSDRWRAGIAPEAGRGASLRDLAGFLAAGLGALGAAPAEVAATPLTPAGPDDLADFRAALLAGEATAGVWIIANYYMETVIGRGDYGHFSPVGAYDAGRDRVLLLDVYRQELEPYWVPAERLLAGMALPSRTDGEARGYLVVRLPHPA